MRVGSKFDVRNQHSVETELTGSLLPCRIAIALSAARAARATRQEADVALEDKRFGYMANAETPWHAGSFVAMQNRSCALCGQSSMVYATRSRCSIGGQDVWVHGKCRETLVLLSSNSVLGSALHQSLFVVVTVRIVVATFISTNAV